MVSFEPSDHYLSIGSSFIKFGHHYLFHWVKIKTQKKKKKNFLKCLLYLECSLKSLNHDPTTGANLEKLCESYFGVVAKLFDIFDKSIDYNNNTNTNSNSNNKFINASQFQHHPPNTNSITSIVLVVGSDCDPSDFEYDGSAGFI
ncbi:hypothetical protein ACTFIY_004734 [Dictyostelium cf. discoideum]